MVDFPPMKALWVVAGAVACYIVIILFNYDSASIHPESIMNEAYSFENGPAPKIEDFARGLNYIVFELAEPRITRPLSNIFQLFDAKIRVWLWRFMPPHPALGLKVLLCLLLVPPLLYYSCRNLAFGAELSLVCTLIYVCSPGFLSPLVMYFHPGKGILNLVFVFLLWVISRDSRRLRMSGGQWEGAVPVGKYLLLTAFLLFSFFWDETALFLYLFFPVFFFSLWRAFGRPFLARVLPAYLALPGAYYVLVRHILPSLYVKLGYELPNIYDFSAFPGLGDLFAPDPRALLGNLILLFADHVHLQAPALFTYGGWGTTAIAWAYQLLIVSLIVLPPLAFLSRRWRGRYYGVSSGLRMAEGAGASAEECDSLREYAIMIAVIFGLMLSYIWFQTFLFSKNFKTWGDCWYGALFSFLFSFFLAAVLRWHLAGIPRRRVGSFLLAATVLLVAGKLMFFTHRNWVYKQRNIFHILGPYDIYNGNADCYRLYDFKAGLKRSAENRAFTKFLWGHRNTYRDNPVSYQQVLDVGCSGGECRLEKLSLLRTYDFWQTPNDNTSAYLDVELPFVR
ncbi:MAG: hypothetical protein ACYC9Y_02600 [Candidatus Methylomirabilia bacterium]